jgi:hypothetical protein
MDRLHIGKDMALHTGQPPEQAAATHWSGAIIQVEHPGPPADTDDSQ